MNLRKIAYSINSLIRVDSHSMLTSRHSSFLRLRPKRSAGALLFLLFSLSAHAEIRLVTGDATGAGHDADQRVLDISADGKQVLFHGDPSRSGPSPGIARSGFYLRDMATDLVTLLLDEGVPLEGSISKDGRFLAYPKGNNIWRYDRFAQRPQVISSNPNDECRSPQISDDGRYIAYASVATSHQVENPDALPPAGLPYVVLYDEETDTRRIVTTAPNGGALETGFGGVAWWREFSLSGNGRYLFYSTDAPNAHPDRSGAADQAFFWLYRRDLQTGEITVAGKAGNGGVPPGNMTTPSSSSNGQRVLFAGAFISGSGLVPGYTNAFGSDLYWKDLGSGKVIRVTATEGGANPDGAIEGPSLSPDGLHAAFASTAKNLVVPDEDNFFDIYSARILPDQDSVDMTLASVGPDPSRNVDYTSGPFAANDYVVFTTQQWEEMLGEADAQNSARHGVAVGTFPPPPPDNGAEISILEDETVGFMPVALSADGTRALIIERDLGYQRWEIGGTLSVLPGTGGVSRNTRDAHANSDLSAMVGRRFGNDGEEIVYYSDTTGAVVLPAAPGQGDARIELHAVLEDGSVLLQYRARNPETDEFQNYTYQWSPGGNWTDLTDVFRAAKISEASPGGALGEPVRESFNTPRDRLFRWTPGGGYEELSLPVGMLVSGNPFGLNKAGTVFFIRMQAEGSFENPLYRWKDDAGFTEVANPGAFDGFDGGATTANGALSAVETTFWAAGRGTRILKDDLLANGADPTAFTTGRIDRIADVAVVDGKTLFFGRMRTFDFRHTHFIAALPFVPTEGRRWGSFTVDSSGFADTGDWFGFVWLGDDSGLVWSYAINEWIFLPGDNISDLGAWAFLNRPAPPAPADGANGRWLEFPLDESHFADTGAWIGFVWRSPQQPDFVWSFAMSTFLFLPETNVGPNGGWGYLTR